MTSWNSDACFTNENLRRESSGTRNLLVLGRLKVVEFCCLWSRCTVGPVQETLGRGDRMLGTGIFAWCVLLRGWSERRQAFYLGTVTSEDDHNASNKSGHMSSLHSIADQ
jgi:hypothetical protein